MFSMREVDERVFLKNVFVQGKTELFYKKFLNMQR